MGDPEERLKHARRRQRNFVAKKLREDQRFRQKRVPNKLKKLLAPRWSLKDGDIVLNEEVLSEDQPD